MRALPGIRFDVQSLADEPQVLHALAPTEAVVAIAIEVKAATTTGMINLAIPSIFVKRLRHNFEQLRRIHRAESKRRDQDHMAELLRKVNISLEVRLAGCTISMRDLLAIETGDVLMLEHPVGRKAIALLNGQPKYYGNMAQSGAKLTYEIAFDYERD